MKNPYILDEQKIQELGGIQPMYQNTANQQAMQAAALAQGNQLMQQAGQTGQQGGSNPMALAMALRKGEKGAAVDPNAKDAAMGGLATYNPMTQMAISSKYDTNPYSQQSRMLAAQEKDFL